MTGEPTPLSFLVHFVGDIHQPLHAGYGCDKGASSSYVYFYNKRMSLHSVWDSGIIDHYGGSWVDFAAELQQNINDHPYMYTLYSLIMLPEWWTDESYNNYVRHIVYDFNNENKHSGNKSIYPENVSCPFNTT